MPVGRRPDAEADGESALRIRVDRRRCQSDQHVEVVERIVVL